MKESLKTILEKMCSYVNADYESIDFKEPQWFWKYEWTKDQEDDFTEWLAELIRTDNTTRKELTTLHYRPSKKLCRKFAHGFSQNFGWRLK